MSGKAGYVWHLRRLMAERGLFATTELRPLLAGRGVVLSREQVYRLVVRTPERLSLATLAALCDILGCGPGDLVEPACRAWPGPAGGPADAACSAASAPGPDNARSGGLGGRCLRGRTRTGRRRPAPALPGLPQDPGGGPGGGGGGVLAGNSGRGRYGRGDHQPAGTA